jgi:protein-disulfide isomerase/uncharacterized membrane protein
LSAETQPIRRLAPPLSRPRRWLGAAALSLAASASAILALQHFRHLNLPFCAPRSDCYALASGSWGSVAGWWPVSFIGAAYFAALLLAWLTVPNASAAQSGVPWAMKWLTRLGMAGSAWFVGVMAVEQLFCAYCLAVHVGNLAFWCVVETTASVPSARRPAAVFLAVALAVSLSLGLANNYRRHAADQQASDQLQEAVRQIIEISRRPAEPLKDQGAFEGRYLLGEAASPIRVVVFTDYECGYCRALDQRLQAALAGDRTVNLSIKHFPLCQECNPVVGGARSHENACKAAWAAETAGRLGGTKGFWTMHRWLFARRGKFSDKELTAALPTLGFEDPQKFLATLKGETTDGLAVRDHVADDVAEGQALGVRATPVLYLNGVPLEAPSKVGEAMAALRQAGLPPRTAAFDRPPMIVEELHAKWRQQPTLDIPPGKARWAAGPENAPVRIVIFLDSGERASADLARVFRRLSAGRPHVRLECFHFPFSVERHALSRLTEAAGRVGGQDAMWRMHDWLCQQKEEPTLEAALAAAASLKLDREKLAVEFAAEATRQAVDADIQFGAACKVSGAPMAFINGRPVDQPLPPRLLLERILDEAPR